MRRLPLHRLVAYPGLVASAAFAACAPAPTPTPTAAPAPPPPPVPVTATYVVLQGADTLAVEQVTREPDRVRGEVALRIQGGLRQDWTIALDPGGRARAAELVVRRADAAPDAPPARRTGITIGPDGAVRVEGDTTVRTRVEAGTVPYVNLSAGVIEQILRSARDGGDGGDSVHVPLLPLGTTGTVSSYVRWLAPDSAALRILNVELVAALDSTGRLRTAAVPAQRVRFVRTTAPLSLDFPGPVGGTAGSGAPDYAAPPGAPYTAEAATVRNAAAGVSLAGTLTVPRHAAGTRVPAVVLISGSGPQDRDGGTPVLPGWRPFRQLADTLGRRGIAVLRLDDRGVGASDAGPPGATSADLAGDVRAALAWLRAHPAIDPARVAVLGHSEGGIIAPMVARDDTLLRAVVLVAAQSRAGRVVSDSQVAQALRERGTPAAAIDSLVRVNAPLRDSVAAQQPWIAYWLAYDPLPAARALRVPTLVVQGETDRQVSADQADELAAAIRAGGNRDVTARRLPDVNHLLVRDASGDIGGYRALPSLVVVPEVLGAIADWLAGKLGV